MATKTNVLPNNLEAEQALLGCLLIDNDILTDILDLSLIHIWDQFDASERYSRGAHV